jgi:hypothetical protein
MQVLYSKKNLTGNELGFLLAERSLVLRNHRLQITTWTEVDDQEEPLGCLEGKVKLHDVGVVGDGEHITLSLNVAHPGLLLLSSLVQHLHGVQFAAVGEEIFD